MPQELSSQSKVLLSAVCSQQDLPQTLLKEMKTPWWQRLRPSLLRHFFFFYSSFTLNHEFTPPFGAGCWSPTKKKKIKGINELLPPNQGVPLASGRRTREHFKGPGSLSLGARAAPFLSIHPGGKVSPKPELACWPYMASKAQFPLAQAQAGWKKICFLCYSAHVGLWKSI